MWTAAKIWGNRAIVHICGSEVTPREFHRNDPIKISLNIWHSFEICLWVWFIPTKVLIQINLWTCSLWTLFWHNTTVHRFPANSLPAVYCSRWSCPPHHGASLPPCTSCMPAIVRLSCRWEQGPQSDCWSGWPGIPGNAS